jgi:triosephosphate isomerase
MVNRQRKPKDYPIVIANWKMNGLLLESMQMFKILRSKINASLIGCEIVICPPYTLLRDFAEKIPGTGIKIGAQNCHDELEGAYTGSISTKMLRDMNCSYVIVGHSERRTTRNEGSELVNKKAKACHSQGLKSIICVGETIYEKDNDLAKIVIREQVLHSIPKTANAENTIIAYEPIWAIGTGKTPTLEEIDKMHGYINEVIKSEMKQFDNNEPRVVYGGSISSSNSKSILSCEHVDGLLVGKASLDINEFWKIIESAG